MEMIMLSFNQYLEAIQPQELSDIKGMNLPDTPYEIGMVDGDKTSGGPDRIQLKLGPPKEDKPHELIVHTHPVKPDEEPTQLRALPSEQDLKSAVDAFKLGYPGMAIFSGPFFTIFKPSREDILVSGYDKVAQDAIAQGDPNIALEKIKQLGFEVGTGRK